MESEYEKALQQGYNEAYKFVDFPLIPDIDTDYEAYRKLYGYMQDDLTKKKTKKHRSIDDDWEVENES